MERLTRYTLITCGAIALAGLMGFIGYRIFSGDELDTKALELSAAEPIRAVAEEPEPVAESAAVDGEVLKPQAKITYRYYYLKDGHIDSTTEEAPYFLVGLSRMELAEKLMGWELITFSPELAVFEKKLNAMSTERYTVGVQNGYVAVFYDEEVNGSRLKEQTEIPVDALSEEELTRLGYGIRVVGEEQLAKVLEDYGS